MNRTLKVMLDSRQDNSYEIEIENGLSHTLGLEIGKSNFGKKYCIIADSQVAKVAGKKLLSQFAKQSITAHIISFPRGEQSKNIKVVEMIVEKMSKLGFDRKDCIVALGGGVSGDIAGFCAAIYLRGINFVQVPTTLLAMVDSSIGGKTGVNLKSGKNLVGSFYQPKKVYICPEFLESLPKSEVAAGMSEVIKHAIVADARLFYFIEQNISKIISLDPNVMEQLIEKNCKIKAEVVEKDEKEVNYRKIINYGHTIGHALESIGNYKQFSHGQAVAIGMRVEAKISQKMGFLNLEEENKIKNLLEQIGLPTKMPKIDLHKVIAATRKDKKAVSGKVYYSLPQKIGKMHQQNGSYSILPDDKIVFSSLEDCL